MQDFWHKILPWSFRASSNKLIMLANINLFAEHEVTAKAAMAQSTRQRIISPCAGIGACLDVQLSLWYLHGDMSCIQFCERDQMYLRGFPKLPRGHKYEESSCHPAGWGHGIVMSDKEDCLMMFIARECEGIQTWRCSWWGLYGRRIVKLAQGNIGLWKRISIEGGRMSLG